MRSPGSGWAPSPTQVTLQEEEERRDKRGEGQRDSGIDEAAATARSLRATRSGRPGRTLPGPWGPPRASHPDAPASPSPQQTDPVSSDVWVLGGDKLAVQDVRLSVVVLPPPTAHQLLGASLLAIGHCPREETSISLWAPLPLPSRVGAQVGQRSGRPRASVVPLRLPAFPGLVSRHTAAQVSSRLFPPGVLSSPRTRAAASASSAARCSLVCLWL